MLAVAVPVAATWLGKTQAVDLAYQVRAGDLILDTHHLLTRDVFTFTVPGHNWLDQQWLAQTFFAAIWRAGGWDTVAFIWGCMVGAVVLFVFLACREKRADTTGAVLLSLAAYLVGVQILTMRPQLIGVVLFAAVQWILTTRHRSPRRLWIIPLLVAVWANVHGSFILVFAQLGFAWLEDRGVERAFARQLVLVAASSVLASFATPFGIHVWSYVGDIAANPTVAGRVAEWGPPSVRTPVGLLFFGSLLGAFAILALGSMRPSWQTILALCFYAVLGMAAIRGGVWWAITFPVLVAPFMPGIFERPPSRSPVNAVFLGALGLLLAIAAPIHRGVDQMSGGPDVLTFAPQDLVTAATGAVPPGTRVFASEVYGSWIEFSAPDLPVFVDPRIELFPARVWDDYFAISSGREGWDERLHAWGVKVVILHPTWADGLLAVIGRNHEWHLVAHSDEGWVYVRT